MYSGVDQQFILWCFTAHLQQEAQGQSGRETAEAQVQSLQQAAARHHSPGGKTAI